MFVEPFIGIGTEQVIVLDLFNVVFGDELEILEDLERLVV
jgi:hypothetical protein